MSFAEQWIKSFTSEYKLEQIDEWWNRLRNPSDQAWTSRLAEFLRALANKRGFQMEYEIPTDFSWYRQGSMYPSVAIEHENAYSTEIYRKELPKLLASGASLKVLITYPKNMREENRLVNWILANYKKPKLERKTKQPTDEFLLLLDEPEGKKANWRPYIFLPNGKLRRSGRKTTKLSDVV